MADSTSKPKCLILGGTGFIGRHLTEYLITENLVSKIRIVDKVPPQMAWLNSNHQKIYSHPNIEFVSANLVNESSCCTAFDGEEFDYVVNLAGETKLGKSDAVMVYEEGIVKLSVNCATESSKRNVKRYVEVASGHVVGNNTKAPVSELDKVTGRTVISKFKLQAEENLKSIPHLDYVILRPATVYGIGDKSGLIFCLMLGAIYRHLGETMTLLWSRDMRMNTVHVQDLARAIWHVATKGTPKEVYNVVDKGNSTQGEISDIISTIFNTNHSFLGTAISYIAKHSDMTDINDKHLTAWAQMCTQQKIENTPLSPYLQEEHFSPKQLYLNGSKLESTGFSYAVPKMTVTLLKEVVNDYVRMSLFPSQALT